MTIPILINFKNGEEGAKFFEWVCGYKPIKEGGSEIILLSGWHTKDNTRAAPDLLEACKMFVRSQSASEGMAIARAHAVKAIAKAEGKA